MLPSYIKIAKATEELFFLNAKMCILINYQA